MPGNTLFLRPIKTNLLSSHVAHPNQLVSRAFGHEAFMEHLYRADTVESMLGAVGYVHGRRLIDNASQFDFNKFFANITHQAIPEIDLLCKQLGWENLDSGSKRNALLASDELYPHENPYFVKFSILEKACRVGCLEAAQWIWGEVVKEFDVGQIPSSDYIGIFYAACQNGHIDVADWLWSKVAYAQDDQRINELRISWLDSSFDNRHQKLFQWLWDQMDEAWQANMLEKFELLFRISCGRGHLEAA